MSSLWEYVLSAPTTKHGTNITRRPRKETPPGSSNLLSLLAVCRTTHNETAGIFYYHQTLQIGSHDIRSFVKSTSFPRRINIRNLRVNVDRLQQVTLVCRCLRYMPHIADVSFVFVASSDHPWLGNHWWLESALKQEAPMLKRCGLRSVPSASIRIEPGKGRHH